jgi:tetratricopeptide (TPR) repeat protein
MRCSALLLILGFLLTAQETTRPTRDLTLARDGAVRRALLIGNTAYPKFPLRNPAHDVTDLESVLKRMRFQVEVVSDAGLEEIRQAVGTFADNIRQGDEALFYYAGHGVQIDYENYLVPVDFTPVPEERLKEVCYPFQEVKRKLEGTRAGVVILMMDACRTNPFGKGPGKRTGLAVVEAGLGSYIVFSAAPGQTASDNVTERNGLFTKHFLETVQSPLNISDLFREVRRNVYAASGQEQLPYLHDQVLQPFYFVAPKSTPATMPKLTRSTLDLLEKGKYAYHAGDCGEALQFFDQASRQDPENALAFQAAGVALACTGQNAQAVQRFNEAIALRPDLGAAYMNRGTIYLREGQYKQAVRDFTWAIEQDPGNDAAYWRRGHAVARLRQYENALEDFTQSIELNGSDPNPYFGRGKVRHQMGRDREALADLNAAILRKSDFGEAYWQRARVRKRLGDGRGAAADGEMAERLGVRDWLLR